MLKLAKLLSKNKKKAVDLVRSVATETTKKKTCPLALWNAVKTEHNTEGQLDAERIKKLVMERPKDLHYVTWDNDVQEDRLGPTPHVSSYVEGQYTSFKPQQGSSKSTGRRGIYELGRSKSTASVPRFEPKQEVTLDDDLQTFKKPSSMTTIDLRMLASLGVDVNLQKMLAFYSRLGLGKKGQSTPKKYDLLSSVHEPLEMIMEELGNRGVVDKGKSFDKLSPDELSGVSESGLAETDEAYNCITFQQDMLEEGGIPIQRKKPGIGTDVQTQEGLAEMVNALTKTSPFSPSLMAYLRRRRNNFNVKKQDKTTE
jgi:hypothetical protein